MARKKKAAAKLTTREAVNRIFGKGAAKQLRKLVAQLDAEKGSKKRRKPGPK
jgi:hypothetical protein